MKIAIIGAGNIGSALAKRLVKKHTVLMGVLFPLSGAAIKLAQEIGEDRFNTIESVVKQMDVIIVATPLDAIPNVAAQLKNVTGKIIIETSNAFGKPLPEFANGTIAIKRISGSDKVVKCFNTIGAEDLADPVFRELKADAFVAGANKEAKQVAQAIATDIGFGNCFDLGGDEALPLLENLAVTWGALAYQTGLGRRVAFKVLRDA